MLTLAGTSGLFAADHEQPRFVASSAFRDDDGFCVHRVTSEFQSGETLIRVLLPDHCDVRECLRVLYVLPVEAKSERRYGDGLLEAKKLDLANKHRLICVAPTFAQMPWYADHPTDNTIRQESHFVKVVVPTVEELYPALVQRDGRLLVGFSKSGFGAWTLLLRHPDLFAKAAAWDAPLMQAAPNQFGMAPIYGSAENFEKHHIERLLRVHADGLKATEPNEDDKTKPRLMHLGFGNFREHHRRVELVLNELHIPHVYRDGPRREHTWHSGWLGEAVRTLLE